MRHVFTAGALALGVLLLAAACQGGYQGGYAPAPAPEPAPPPAAPAPAPAGEVRTIEVTATEFQFTPATIPVQPGERVRFVVTNGGAIFHTFTMQIGGQTVDLPLNPGETKEAEVTIPSGVKEVAFWCRPHRGLGMEGTLTVGGK